MIKLTFVVLCFFSIAVFPQIGKFKIDADYARFHYDDSTAYVEVYYSFYTLSMKTYIEKGVKSAKGSLKIEIKDLSTKVIISAKEYQFTTPILDSTKVEDTRSLIGNMLYQLKPGKYNFKLTGRDLVDTTRIDTLSFQVQVAKLDSSHFSVSDLQLSTSIKKSDDTESFFYKNTYEVVPNPIGVYGVNMPVIFFYSELYNVNVNVQSEYLKVDYILLNAKNQIALKKSKLISRKNSSIVEAGALNISKIPSGSYTLALAVGDSLLNITSVSSKNVYIYNPSVIDTTKEIISDADFFSSEFASMEMEETEEAFMMAKYIATKQEIAQWGTIKELDGRRKFLFNYWRGRDKEPGTPENEFKREYYDRINYSNQQFSTFTKRGWKTDRGRVYIVYGEPSEVERFPNQVDSKPYEIWTYHNIEGGVIFAFGDLTGYADYLLLHSTLRGELRDENWKRRVSSFNEEQQRY